MGQEDLSRRQFLNVAVNAIGALITAVVAVPVAGYFIDPVLRGKSGAGDWVKLAPVGELGADPKEFQFSTVRSEGFMKQEVSAKAYAYVEGDKARAFSNICTHLGCPAGWDGSKQKFFCPCHGGVYDKSGQNVAGPPPRPLPPYETKIEDGYVYIQIV